MIEIKATAHGDKVEMEHKGEGKTSVMIQESVCIVQSLVRQMKDIGKKESALFVASAIHVFREELDEETLTMAGDYLGSDIYED